MYAEVKTINKLSPNMIRVVFAGGELDQFTPVAETDAYINARFIPTESPLSVPFDKEEADALDPDHRPRPRRYTVRAWDVATQELTIDFVVHGDDGFAGPWAQRAQPGDRLQFVGPRGNYRPSTEVDWHLLAGDESALPAIAAALDVLVNGDVARVYVVVDSPEHHYPLATNAELEVTWLYRQGSENPETLLDHAIADADLSGAFHAFIHGEAGEVRSVRRILSNQGVDLSEHSISAYWRRHHTDEAWREIKRGFMSQS